MKKILTGAIFSLMLLGAKAQEAVTFTDEDLSKYASVMVWAENEKLRMKDSVQVWVKSNEKLSASQYNVLSKANKKGTTNEVEATEEEKAAFSEIQEKIEGQKANFKEVYTGKIKSDIGAGLYNKLKKALRADQEVKARYDAVFEVLKNEGTEAAAVTE